MREPPRRRQRPSAMVPLPGWLAGRADEGGLLTSCGCHSGLVAEDGLRKCGGGRGGAAAAAA